ncbi:MAG: response regulator [Pseudoxanthomonas sp.]|nr:response regulator [Pseudoxanthomonas sp.]
MNLLAATSALRRMKVLGYCLAVLLSLLALWLRFQLDNVPTGFPFITFYLAVLFAALLGGLGPGLLAVVFTGLLSQYFFMAPVNSFSIESPSGWIPVVLYWGTTLTMVALVNEMTKAYEAQLRAQAQLRELNDTLEERIAERNSQLTLEMKDRETAEAQLRQLQKMESIGQLTGGLAHDFNNMMAIVIGSLDVAKLRLSSNDQEKIRACIDNAMEGAQRATVLTSRLLAFSRQQPLAPQAIDANKLISGMSELLRRTIAEHVQVEIVLAGGLWHCFADTAQLESALVNLAVNARDAMPDGGKLTIETANAELDDRYARSHPEVQSGQYVLIAVSDSGTGMSALVIERAFDPFYTTKEVGKGTGLGLSQVYGYVKQSGGHVKIYSELGQGSTIKLYLPRHLGHAPPATPVGDTEFMPRGSLDQFILVVEDDQHVRHMTVDALRELGYTVVQASDANQALEQIRVQPHLDLLFTDIVMPVMNGRVLADQARLIKPKLRVLFTTGYTRNAVVHNGMLDPGVAFLPKPFTIQQLALKVRDVLNGEGFNRS